MHYIYIAAIAESGLFLRGRDKINKKLKFCAPSPRSVYVYEIYVIP